MSFSVRDIDAVPAWQQRALQRSLAGARERSVERLAGLIDAARQLATETGSADFTVQQVVNRAGQSLKAFYKYFEGKDDLLLALIEDDSRIGAVALAELVDDQVDPVERLRAFVRNLSIFGSVGDRAYVQLLLRERARLDEADSDRMAVALAPFTELLEGLLAGVADAGLTRHGEPERDAAIIFNLVMANIHVQLLNDGDGEDAADYLWDFCWSGIGDP